jgi:NAD(P)-dependent dehydrogenase (short-subunit alcohol dehydrogenase family)
MRLKDKRALITGGSKGIGKSIALAFVKEGASVVICGRNEETLKKAVKEISPFGEIDSFKADISNLDDTKRLASFIEDKWNRLDVLVNNASIFGVKKQIIEYPEDVWVRVIDVNINGQFFVTKALLPLLLRSKSASIINLSSGVGKSGRAYWGAYAASKFAVEGFTQVLADELSGTQVRVNAVNPGGTRTTMRAEAYPKEDPMTLPHPDTLTPLFVYLASDESSRMSGHSIDARSWLKIK